MSAPTRAAAPARLASVAAALALLATLIFRPALGSVGARAMGPLPACRYDDILTTPRTYADWPITLVDTILRVPVGYVPPDLVPASRAGIAGGGKVRAVMIDDLRAVAQAAGAAGNRIGVESAYRSYAEQEEVFDSWVKRYGYDEALMVPARPGHSEHQLGLAIDFRTDPSGGASDGPWGSTPAGKWMKAHAWEYGFVTSYPKGTSALTCYEDEPWHFRYVGRELAALIHASGLTPREYLWAAYTTTVVPPPPSATSVPASGPTPGPTPTTTPAPTDAPVLVVTTAPTPAPAVTEPPRIAPVAWSQPAILAGLAVGLFGVLGVAWLALRRGRHVR
jgi:D-alanyl-D-alanine carboxypeptidase